MKILFVIKSQILLTVMDDKIELKGDEEEGGIGGKSRSKGQEGTWDTRSVYFIQVKMTYTVRESVKKRKRVREGRQTLQKRK